MRLARIIFLCICIMGIGINSLEAGDNQNPSKKTGAVMSSSILRDAKTIDVNRVACYFYNDGSFGSNPVTGEGGFHLPEDQDSLSVIYSAGLWILGKMQVDTLRGYYASISRYASEFQPGVMLTDSTADDPDNDEYMIYKYNTGEEVDQEALDQGCPEEVLGDQMLFSVYNDLRTDIDIWPTPRIGLEVQQTTFAYDEPGGLGRTIFSRYRIFNKGRDNLDSAYVAIWMDADVGMSNDDFAGCDTTLGLVYAFNGDDFDEKYGTLTPAVGCDLLQGPIVDAPGETAVLPDGTELMNKRILGTTATFFYASVSALPGMTHPGSAEDAYNSVSGLGVHGEPWLDPVQGDNPTTFPFAGDPVTGSGWLIESAISPKDIKMGIATGPFDMAPGDSQDVVIALIAAQGTDYLNSISVLRAYDLAAQLAYESGFDVVASAENFAYIPEKTTLSQNYPNPFNPSTQISFSLSRPDVVSLDVYNILGKRVATLVQGKLSPGHHEARWEPQGLSSGIYLCQLKVGDTVLTRKLLFQK
jgi:hypothetical protein